MLKDEGTTQWDWILRSLAEGDPARMREIRERCTPVEIARAYAMTIYAESAEPIDHG